MRVVKPGGAQGIAGHAPASETRRRDRRPHARTRVSRQSYW
jgi:hypothetical protein